MTKVKLLYKLHIHSNTSEGQREKKPQLQYQHQGQRNGSIKHGTVGLLLFQSHSPADDSDSHQPQSDKGSMTQADKTYMFN